MFAIFSVPLFPFSVRRGRGSPLLPRDPAFYQGPGSDPNPRFLVPAPLEKSKFKPTHSFRTQNSKELDGKSLVIVWTVFVRL